MSDVTAESAQEFLAREADRVTEVQQVLLAELAKVELDGKCQGILKEFTDLELATDPFDKSKTLNARWKNAFGMNQGSIQLLENGQVFAEYDVLVVHPTKKKWFIEAVTAWGRSGKLKSELRLIPVPGE